MDGLDRLLSGGETHQLRTEPYISILRDLSKRTQRLREQELITEPKKIDFLAAFHAACDEQGAKRLYTRSSSLVCAIKTALPDVAKELWPTR